MLEVGHENAVINMNDVLYKLSITEGRTLVSKLHIYSHHLTFE